MRENLKHPYLNENKIIHALLENSDTGKANADWQEQELSGAGGVSF